VAPARHPRKLLLKLLKRKILGERKREPLSVKFSAALSIATLTLLASPIFAQQPGPPPILREVSIAQRLNEPIPPEIIFRDENGKAVHLGDYFGTKPIVLSLVYFDCPALCTEVLNANCGR